jgi:hypothetical protein
MLEGRKSGERGAGSGDRRQKTEDRGQRTEGKQGAGFFSAFFVCCLSRKPAGLASGTLNDAVKHARFQKISGKKIASPWFLLVTNFKKKVTINKIVLKVSEGEGRYEKEELLGVQALRQGAGRRQSQGTGHVPGGHGAAA